MGKSLQRIAAVIFIISTTIVQAQTASRAVPGQVVIKYKTERNFLAASASLETLGIAVVKSLPELAVMVGEFPPQRNVEDMVRICSALPNVEYAEPNYYVHALGNEPEILKPERGATVVENTLTGRSKRPVSPPVIEGLLQPGAIRIPNDPRFGEQWSLNNSNDADIDAPEAWDIQIGSSEVIVGVVDTGIDYHHEDLQDNIWRNPGESGDGKESNGIDDDGNGYTDDWHGWNFVSATNDPYDDHQHGTYNAGVIGARGNNGKGISGVNWRVHLMPLKFLDRDGSGTTEGAAEAIIYAVKNGAQVLSNSWGGGEFSYLLEDVIKFADQNGVLFIAGAGGAASNLDCFPVYPANYELPNVVAVTRSDRNDSFVPSGNYGRRTVHLVAPSSSVISTQPLNRYQLLSGTAHTPHVAGVCALIWAADPRLTARQVLVRLLGSVDRKPEFIERTITGGRLNAANALSTKPIIAYTTATNSTADPIGPYLFKTTVLDDGVLRRVSLVYSKNGMEADTLEMATAGQDVYMANLPIQTLKNTIQYRVFATDNDGNRTMSANFNLLVGAAPIPSFTPNKFLCFTNNARPTFYWGELSEAVRYHVNLAIDTAFALNFIDSTAAPFYTPPVPLPDGDWSIRLRSVSRYNLLSAWSDDERFTIDTVAPVIIKMNINDGALYANARAVTLNFEVFGARLEVDSLRLSQRSDFFGTAWSLFGSTRVPWNLAEGEDGPRTVYAEFKDLAGNVSAPDSASVILERQKPFFPETTPRLSVATPALNQPVTVTLAPPEDRGVGIKSFVLFYRRAGESWQMIPFKTDTATIPKEFVTVRGLDYRIVAEDSVGNRSLLPDSAPYFFSIPVSLLAGEAGSFPGSPGGTTAAAYRLVSLPLIVANPAVSEVFTNLGTYGVKRGYRFWRLEADKQWHEEGDQLKVQLGESYFLITRPSKRLSNKSAGVTAQAAVGALGNVPGWRLRADDWTLIGNPFNFEIALENLRLKNKNMNLRLDSTQKVWSYNGEWEMNPVRLEKWGGLAVFNTGAVDTLLYWSPFDDPPPGSSTAEKNALTPSNAEHEWMLPIRTESEVGRDYDNYFGVRQGARPGRDQFDYDEPPLLPGGVSLSFLTDGVERPKALAVDIRPPQQQGNDWILLIQGQSENIVKMHFEDLEKLPPGLEIWLVDDALKITQNLRETNHYSVAGSEQPKQLKLVVGKRSFVAEKLAAAQLIPATYELSQNFPNPFNPATTIRYGLPNAERVTLKIYNLLGAEVAALVNDEQKNAGYHAAIWDGRDKNRHIVSSGVYVYRMQAGSFVMTKKLALVK